MSLDPGKDNCYRLNPHLIRLQYCTLFRTASGAHTLSAIQPTPSIVSPKPNLPLLTHQTHKARAIPTDSSPYQSYLLSYQAKRDPDQRKKPDRTPRDTYGSATVIVMGSIRGEQTLLLDVSVIGEAAAVCHDSI